VDAGHTDAEPEPASVLSGVTATSARNAWAVGYYVHGTAVAWRLDNALNAVMVPAGPAGWVARADRPAIRAWAKSTQRHRPLRQIRAFTVADDYACSSPAVLPPARPVATSLPSCEHGIGPCQVFQVTTGCWLETAACWSFIGALARWRQFQNLRAGRNGRSDLLEDLMATWVWILIAFAIVVVVALFALAARRRRTAMLRRRFGPEYDRTLQAREDRGAAEADLRARQRQRAQLDLKPLPEDARLRFAGEWREVQERFVDQPTQAVVAADTLISQVMEARGYPVKDFEAQADLVSVDHPDVVENYRFAHGVRRSRQASTEDLREALLRYRSLFDKLLRPGGDGTASEASQDAASQSPAAIADGGTAGTAEADTGSMTGGPTDGGAASPADAAGTQTADDAYEDHQVRRGGR
jgi:hypothetical protein